MRYLLGTNICIYIMKRQPPEVIARLENLHYGDVAISAITLAELRASLELNPATRAHNERALDALLQDIPAFGNVRATRSRSDQTRTPAPVRHFPDRRSGFDPNRPHSPSPYQINSDHVVYPRRSVLAYRHL